jgi:hypothetical protein
VKGAPEPEKMPESEQLGRTVRAILGALEEEPELESESGVKFNNPSASYAIEQGLTDCIERGGNHTCYLAHELASSSRVELRCFSNDWKNYAFPLRISSGFSYGEGGAVLKVREPNGVGRLEYEHAPHPAIDEGAAEDFYTQVCADALDILDDEPQTQMFASTMPWGESLAPNFEDSFQALMGNGFRVRDEGMKFLRVEFELGDGSSSSMDFFPHADFCSINEPCWKFEAIHGGTYDVEQLVDFAFEHQEELWEE